LLFALAISFDLPCETIQRTSMPRVAWSKQTTRCCVTMRQCGALAFEEFCRCFLWLLKPKYCILSIPLQQQSGVVLGSHW
jgi:hypothetical protein